MNSEHPRAPVPAASREEHAYIYISTYHQSHACFIPLPFFHFHVFFSLFPIFLFLSSFLLFLHVIFFVTSLFILFSSPVPIPIRNHPRPRGISSGQLALVTLHLLLLSIDLKIKNTVSTTAGCKACITFVTASLA